MRRDALTNVLLAVIAIALVAIALRTYREPAVEAQTTAANPFYVEPGVQMLRAPDGSMAVYGKMMVDMRTGNVWGFPTGTPDPYPSNPLDKKPVTSRPILLGRFALDETNK
jgi:hypothetical protein